MTDWDGRGLPPATAARLQRFQAHAVRSSFLTVPAAVSLASAGLQPVGDVMGCRVEYLGWRGYGGCGYATAYGGLGLGGPAAPAAFSGFRPYVDAVYRGYDSALERMLAEASGIGADGVVGVVVTARSMAANTREFSVRGTAVRAASRHRPATPFVTDLDGADVLKLLRAGWVPVRIALGIAVAIRHDDFRTQNQASLWSGNTEVSGYTELVQHARAGARQRFAERAAAAGAEGALVSDLRLRVFEIEPADGHRDHVAEATVLGTAVARFTAGAAQPDTATLTMLPLRTDKEFR